MNAMSSAGTSASATLMNRKLAPQIALSATNAGSQVGVGLGDAGTAATAALSRIDWVVGLGEGVIVGRVGAYGAGLVTRRGRYRYNERTVARVTPVARGVSQPASGLRARVADRQLCQ
jgi:hypothetical protein